MKRALLLGIAMALLGCGSPRYPDSLRAVGDSVRRGFPPFKCYNTVGWDSLLQDCGTERGDTVITAIIGPHQTILELTKMWLVVSPDSLIPVRDRLRSVLVQALGPSQPCPDSGTVWKSYWDGSGWFANVIEDSHTLAGIAWKVERGHRSPCQPLGAED